MSVHHFEHLTVDESLNFKPNIKERKTKLGREERHVDVRACWPPRVFLIAAWMRNLLDTQKFGQFSIDINFSSVTPDSGQLHALTGGQALSFCWPATTVCLLGT